MTDVKRLRGVRIPLTEDELIQFKVAAVKRRVAMGELARGILLEGIGFNDSSTTGVKIGD